MPIRTVVTCPRRQERFAFFLAFVSVASLLSVPSRAACPEFAAPVRYPVGLALAVATGDFNGDGHVDVAAIKGNTGNVSILLGTGSGDFTQGATTASSFNENVVAADFDRDGKLDLVVANSIFDSVALMKGNGNGTFQPPTSYLVHSRPDSMLVADFNRDGKLDLAVIDTASNDIALLLGDGAGGLGTAAFFAVGNGPHALAAGDFNRDGKLDLLTANPLANNVSLLAGDGAGGFAAAVAFAVPQTPGTNGPISITAGDWNGDGKVDFAAANETSQTVSVFLGNGAGSFASPTTLSVGGDPKVITSGDFNSDGIADLAVANFAGGTLSVLKGNGTGGFATAVSFDAGPEPTALAVADVDGDSRPDLVAANRSGSTVAVLMNSGVCQVNCSTFSDAVNYAANGPASVTLGDFNRDGKSDFAALGNLGTVYVYLANGSGAFVLQNNYDLPALGRSLVTGDYDADGILDLAAATSSGVSILYGSGNGAFNVTSIPISSLDFPAPSPSFVVAGDFNRDGRPDLAVTDDARGSVWVLLANGAASFADPVSYAAGSAPKSIAIADFDRDGLSDLVVGNSGSSSVSILRGGAAGTFVLSSATPGGGFASSVVTGDFNGDGKVDIASANSNSSTITVLTGDGTGGFTALPAFASTTPTAIVAADFNLDGKLDLAVANEASNSATVRLGDGLGGFSAVAASAGNGFGPRSLAAGDLDGDGKPDLAIGNQASQTVSIARNSCPRPDLSITKAHSGNFTQRQTGRVYIIDVANGGAGPTTGAVTVTDALPSGLTATSLTGSGWNCSLGTLTCSRSDVLPPTGSYSAITLVVNVSSTAPTLVTNVVTVTGGADITPGNNSASDPATVIANPDLTIAKSHSGSFVQGQTFRTYTLTVSNVAASPGPTSGTVTVVESLPSGLSLVSIGGTGWTCLPAIRTCSRSDVLAGAASYPPITVTVNVDANAPATVSNTATVSGGGEFNTANNGATDVTLIAPAPATCGTFGAAANYSLATGVRDVVVGDFNGDGKADLAASVAGFSGSAFIYAGNGDGSFAAPTTLALGGNVTSLSAADLNGDGRLDLLTTNSTANSIAIAYGNGDGTFPSQIPWFAGVGPNAAAVADFNGDGRLDYATANLGSASVSVSLANTSGGFPIPTDYATDPAPASLAAADFNGDGKIDLVAATGSSSVAILLGVGDGTFSPRINVPVHADARSVTVGDFNGDGKSDLAVAFLAGGEVAVLSGGGNGTFGAAAYYATGAGTSSVAAVDVDHDFKTDLAVSVSGAIVVLPGIGNGTFGPAASYATAAGVGNVHVGDFNGDGKPDLVAGRDPGTGGTVSVLLNTCADLSLTKNHGGTFTQGQAGAAFTLTVNNGSQVSWSRPATLTDAVPAGFVASAISGSGWVCDLVTVSCTRSDLLAAGAAYPPVTVTVAVNSNAPTIVVNSATLSAPGDPNGANNIATDPATINPSGLVAPTNLVASATSASSVNVVWNGVTTAVAYRVFRKAGGAPFALVQTVGAPAYADSGLAANTSYVYQVDAVDGASAIGPPSNADVATTIIFTDDPIVAGTTPVKALHLSELRTAVNAVRAAAGLGAAAFTDAAAAGVPIKAVHLTELRSSLDPARSALGLPTIAWTDPSLVAGMAVKAAHAQEVRLGTK